MGDLSDLIERLEKATGPSMELNGLIWLAVPFDEKCSECGEMHGRHPQHHWAEGGTVDGPDKWLTWYQRDGLHFTPRYTHSIDSALRLVPKGMDWSLYRMDEGDPEEWFNAQVGEHCAEVRSTAAIALCIAALKARESKS